MKDYSVLKWNGKEFAANARTIGDMGDVCFDMKWFSGADKKAPLYDMFRGLEEKNGIRYDITIIPAFRMGKEYVKTVGHYHPPANKYGSFAEIYEVLEGEAIYLLQKFSGKENDVIVIKAKAGDVVPVPHDYGHVTINPSKKDLKMANLVCSCFQSEYQDFATKHGAAYYYLAENNGKWVENKNYIDVPKIRFVKPLKNIGGILKLYDSPEKLEFLSDPRKPIKLN